MIIDFKLLATRLATARTLQLTSLDDASAATGIAPDRLKFIEEASEIPTGDELLILANYYARDFRDFIDSQRPDPFKETELLFRGHKDSFSGRDRRAVQEFLLLCEIEATLENSLGRNTPPFIFTPTAYLLKDQGPQAALALRRFFKYEKKEIKLDVYADFRRLGFHVFRRRLINPDISGLYIEHPIAGHCILINYDDDIYRQRFSASHEAAHAIFDSAEAASVSYQRASTKYPRGDLKEIRANRFASAFLMPPELLPVNYDWSVTNSLEIAKKLKVSTEALSYALLEAKLINECDAREIRSFRVAPADKIDPEAPANLSALQLVRRKLLLERGLSDYYVNLCFDAHQNGLISAGRLSEAFLSDHNEMKEISLLYGRNIISEI